MAVPWRYQARCPLPRASEGGRGVALSRRKAAEGYFVTGSCEPTTTVSGLSSRPDCSGPAITRPVRQLHYSSGQWRVTSQTLMVGVSCQQKIRVSVMEREHIYSVMDCNAGLRRRPESKLGRHRSTLETTKQSMPGRRHQQPPAWLHSPQKYFRRHTFEVSISAAKGTM